MKTKSNNVNDSELRDKIWVLIHHYNHSVNSFANTIDVTQQTLNAQTKTAPISLSVIAGILKYYPEISAEWLLRGEGNMNRGESASGGIATASGANSVAAINSEVHSGAEYRALQDKIQMLQQLLDEKERTIRILIER